MKIISLRKGYECDHSTRDYGYISGVKVFYDYGTFDMEFAVPYDTELFKLLKVNNDIDAEKKFNKMVISLYLYCDGFNEDEGKYVELALAVRKAIINKNLEVIKIINAYHGSKDSFSKMKAETTLGKRLQKVLTACW